MPLNISSNKKRWLAVAFMMGVTFVFGTDLFSAENTRPIVRWIMRLLLGAGIDQQTTGTGDGLLRKSAHFLEYALLAWLWFRALRADHVSQWRLTWFFTALVATALWATVDELQQGFISQHRTGSPWDVLLDSTGALSALTLASLIHYLRKSKVLHSSPVSDRGRPAPPTPPK